MGFHTPFQTTSSDKPRPRPQRRQPPPGTVGNPIYWAHSPAPGFDNSKYSGVVALILNEGAAGNFICSGSLLSDRIHVLTAGHCVSSGHGMLTPVSTTAYFYGGNDPQAVVTSVATPGVVAVAASGLSVNPLYTGEVVDDHDIAVVTLAQAAPDFATGYSLYTAGNLTGTDYNVAGYGRRSDQGGSVGADLGTSRLRQGDNRYDFTFGDPDFGGTFDPGPGDTGFFGTAEDKNTLISDFDDGLPGQDASCGLAAAVGVIPSAAIGEANSPKYCDLGVGATEVSTAGGDSGGPQFVNGEIASVTSFGLTFGNEFQPGDIDNTLNDTFGEFNGFVPIDSNLAYINSAAPEPASWAMMMVGFGLLGAATRRRRVAAA